MNNTFFTKEILEKIELLYGDVDSAVKRYEAAIETFKKLYKKEEFSVFSAPGRTEIIGNHTDHQCGIAMAGSVNLDVIGIAAKNDSDIVKVISYGYDKEDIVNVNNLEISKQEKTAAKRRGCQFCFSGGTNSRMSPIPHSRTVQSLAKTSVSSRVIVFLQKRFSWVLSISAL